MATSKPENRHMFWQRDFPPTFSNNKQTMTLICDFDPLFIRYKWYQVVIEVYEAFGNRRGVLDKTAIFGYGQWLFYKTTYLNIFDLRLIFISFCSSLYETTVQTSNFLTKFIKRSKAMKIISLFADMTTFLYAEKPRSFIRITATSIWSNEHICYEQFWQWFVVNI